MKYIFAVIFFLTNICLSPVEAGKNEVLIKYSLSRKDFRMYAINPQDKPDKIKSVNTITAFCNNKDNDLIIEVYARIGFLKIIKISSRSNSYIEINYDSRNNVLYLDSLLGEFDIISFNSHIGTVTRIAGMAITNFASSYRIMSYPEKNIYIKIVEGKINVDNGNESILLITGESCEIEGKSVKLSEISDPETSRIILNNKLISQFDKIIKDNELRAGKSYPDKIKNEYHLIESVKFNILENIFSQTVTMNKNFGRELEDMMISNPSYWNKTLKIYPVRH